MSVLSSGRSFGISPLPVSADPPKALRSMSTTTCLATPYRCRDSLRRRDLVLMPLAVAERQGVDQETLLCGEREQGGGVEAATQEQDGGAGGDCVCHGLKDGRPHAEHGGCEMWDVGKTASDQIGIDRIGSLSHISPPTSDI